MYTPKFASVAAWAKSVGSGAKTRSGQRKAILGSFARTYGLRPVGLGEAINPYMVAVWHEKGTSAFAAGAVNRADYYARQRRARQERFAANHPLTLSMPAPATKVDVCGHGSEFILSQYLQREAGCRGYTRIGEWYVRTVEVVSYDQNYYSKSYTAAFGGRKTTDSRTVLIRRVKADGTIERCDVEVSSWRGNYLLNACIEAGIVEYHKGLDAIRLHPAFDVKLVRKGALSLYERTIGGQHYDFCAVWHGLTYHAATKKAAVAGLRAKLHTARVSKNSPISWELGKKLGFCDEGMRAFAREFGLDVKANYTAEEIAARVAQNLVAARPFEAELRTLAGAVGYKIPNI